MQVGDMVNTPRFLKVRINAVYEDSKRAYLDGYREPTHYDNDPEYNIRGAHTGPNMMVFAAVRK